MRISIWEIMTRLRLFIEVHPFRLKVENIQIKWLKRPFGTIVCLKLSPFINVHGKYLLQQHFRCYFIAKFIRHTFTI